MADRARSSVVSRGESDLLVFISSVMSPELAAARETAFTVLDEMAMVQPWAFEFAPASSESASDAYLRRVEESDFVVWLIGSETTPPVVAEVNSCIGSAGRLLAFKFPAPHRDAQTKALIRSVSKHVKWQCVRNVDDLAVHLKAAVEDELIKAFRDPSSPQRKHRLTELLRVSIANCKQTWITLGVPESIATEFASDSSLGDVLESLGVGVTLVTGDLGTGKTLAVSRVFQRTASRGLEDPTEPFPLFVRAMDLHEPVSDYIHRMTRGFCQPSLQPTLVVIDGLDEIGVTRANALLAQFQAYAEANGKMTGIVTSRTLPGLGEVRRAVEMTTLDDAAAMKLIGTIARRQVTLPEAHSWSESVQDAARYPLFAVMIGSALRSPDDDFRVLQKSQLVQLLAEQALPASGHDAVTLDQLLQRLAVKALDTGRVSMSAISVRRTDRALLRDSRLVNEHDGTVDFTLTIFREWYAARAIIEGAAALDDLSLLSDRWIVPLAIAISSEDSEFEHELLCRLASSDPGLASLVLAETHNEWRRDDGTGTSPTSGPKATQMVQRAMDAWKQGLGVLFRLTGPVTNDGSVRSADVQIDRGRGVATAYWGEGRVNRGSNWRTLTSTEGFPSPRVWPWSMTKKLLVESLSDALDRKWFALESDDATRELAWVLALAVKRQGSLEPTPIGLREILDRVRLLNRYVDDPTARWMSVSIEAKEFSNREVSLVEQHLRVLLDGGVRVIADPWPTADRFPGSGGWVWSPYSEERLLSRTVSVYSAALRIYKTMVDRWFGAFCGRLQLRRLMPVRLEGRLVLSHRGPGLHIHTRSLPSGEQSSVRFGMGPEEEFDVLSYWEEEYSRLRQVRPDSSTGLAPIVKSCALEVFQGRPATALAHRWLAGELSEMGWSNRWYVAP